MGGEAEVKLHCSRDTLWKSPLDAPAQRVLFVRGCSRLLVCVLPLGAEAGPRAWPDRRTRIGPPQGVGGQEAGPRVTTLVGVASAICCCAASPESWSLSRTFQQQPSPPPRDACSVVGRAPRHDRRLRSTARARSGQPPSAARVPRGPPDGEPGPAALAAPSGPARAATHPLPAALPRGRRAVPDARASHPCAVRLQLGPGGCPAGGAQEAAEEEGAGQPGGAAPQPLPPVPAAPAEPRRWPQPGAGASRSAGGARSSGHCPASQTAPTREGGRAGGGGAAVYSGGKFP